MTDNKTRKERTDVGAFFATSHDETKRADATRRTRIVPWVPEFA